MNNPCNECIVVSMCERPCDNTMDYIRDEIMKYKPEGSPVSPRFFLTQVATQIRKTPNMSWNTSLTAGLYGEEIFRCVVVVKDRNIVSIDRRE